MESNRRGREPKMLYHNQFSSTIIDLSYHLVKIYVYLHASKYKNKIKHTLAHNSKIPTD